MTLVTVVIPAYNEEANVGALHDRLCAATAVVRDYEFEFLFVDDGSLDRTPHELATLRGRDPRVRAVRFSRNFGSHAACLAGLIEAHGDLVMIMAADLQDPPELIPEMLAKIAEGFDVILAVRDQRNDPWLTVKLANIYHRLMRRYAIRSWPARGADVVMMRRAVRDTLVGWRQKNTSIFAQLLWLGFRRTTLNYNKGGRHAGKTKWSLAMKFKLFIDSFVSFSFTPIRLISYAGMVISLCGFVYASFIVLNRVLYGKAIPGWSSIMVVLLLVSGFQMLMLGLMGEYLWRVADEVRGSPPFVIQARLGADCADGTDVGAWKDETPGKFAVPGDRENVLAEHNFR